MKTYVAYNLGVRSELDLPELVASPHTAPALTIQVGRIDESPPPSHDGWHYRRVQGQRAYFFWKDVGSFLVEDGQTITIDPAPGVDEDLLRLPLLGPIMAMLLSQRGLYVLHASAVSIRGEVVAFIGRKGWGKSTTAAALHARGHALVTDDLLVVKVDEAMQEVEVAPSFPQLKLWPEAAEASLGDDPDGLASLHQRVTKKARPVPHGFATGTLPLRCIYVLGKGPSLAVEEVPLQQAFVELTLHTYDRKLMQDDTFAPMHFRMRSDILQHVPVRLLRRTRSLTDLPSIARRVEEDVTLAQYPIG